MPSRIATLAALFSIEAINQILKPSLRSQGMVQLSKRTFPRWAYSRSFASTALSNLGSLIRVLRKFNPSELSHQPSRDALYPSAIASSFKASPPLKHFRLYFFASFFDRVLFPV